MIARLGGQTSALFQRWLKKRIPAASQVTLNHRRIFIMPTRAGMGLLLLLLIMLIGAINYQNSLVYAVVFLLGSLFWVGLHHTYRNLAGLELHANGSLPVFAGEEAALTLTLLAPRREHQSVALFWPSTPPRQVDVEQQLGTTLSLYHPTTHRGWFKPDRLRVETRYPLGWFVAWSLVDLDWQVLVYPQPLSLPLPGTRAAEAGEGDQLLAEGVDDFQGLRAYQPGDSKKRLDWRAWSRGQGLHSKVFAEPQHDSLWLSLEQAPGASLEQQLSCLAGWVLQLESRHRPYALELAGQRIGPALGEAHRDACLRALALYGVTP
ncbi:MULTISPECIES: DUF58 domain-containing protein [Halopseudomonas]|uniref:Uncharacterized conserved protein, DUF58 family, contains vWF domain n=2 Tax=Halopseudomonas bauzanensis TaxID=653930 RepID=A0A1H9RJD6_9GAMM|nr:MULTISPECIES: DUF58 domain-containing protein [Halopseudomonas]WGK60191.1 DUF58 domain-containing protein [Halopseudomonas sp. SMJS2]SER72143.1 Uncharacterized conserved protein, DUF58 family, contains vWF domain [Halopseudomonas bauzanensis]SFL58046.1 Uncharacterized conserved protein, DUF58 family, contains vWF domain [Halopseudomonas bauzanensis]